MIPRIIELKNFLSYGPTTQTVDFRNYDLICLCGKNGNGKSALLDALTWVLWGQARKLSSSVRADEGIVHLGQSHMIVSFEFELNSIVYRVRREFAKTYGKPFTALDFEIFNHDRNCFVTLTDKTVRLTQNKIESTLGLDYETFINSSFLRQGHSNEFSKKNPKERKHILANILGLSRYDFLQQKANEKLRNLQSDKKNIEQFILASRDNIIKEKNVEDSLKKELSELNITNAILNKLQQASFNLNCEYASLLEIKKKYHLLSEDLSLVNNTYERKSKHLHAILKEWKYTHSKMLKTINIYDLQNHKSDLNDQMQNFLKLKNLFLICHEKLILAKEQLQKRKNFLVNEYEKVVVANNIELEKRTAYCNEQTKIIDIKKRYFINLDHKKKDTEKFLNNLKKIRTKDVEFINFYEIQKKQFEKRRIFYQTTVNKEKLLSNVSYELTEKQNAINNKTASSCPLCSQSLTNLQKETLCIKIDQQKRSASHQLNRLSDVILNLKNILKDQHKKIMSFEIEFVNIKKRQEQERIMYSLFEEKILEQTQLNKEIATLEAEQVQKEIEINQVKSIFNQDEKRKKSNINYDVELKNLEKTVCEIEKEKKLLECDNKKYQELQLQFNEIEKRLTDISLLKPSIEQQPNRMVQIKFLLKELRDLKNTKAQIIKKQSELALEVKKEDHLLREIDLTKKELDKELITKEIHIQTKSNLEYELKSIFKTKDECILKEKAKDKIDDDIIDYQILFNAFGKDGIQALLIEESIPEIENEANYILSKLTDNQTHLFIESLKDLKNGTIKETLDIQISDSVGLRPYELYSGGEAFRIDFALRIAISKLLAHRAGTALQTLIIDEGFGSQDEDGLARIAETLYLIKNDFAKIIIVSHLTELKNNFPVHINIEKHTSGSSISIEERG